MRIFCPYISKKTIENVRNHLDTLTVLMQSGYYQVPLLLPHQITDEIKFNENLSINVHTKYDKVVEELLWSISQLHGKEKEVIYFVHVVGISLSKLRLGYDSRIHISYGRAYEIYKRALIHSAYTNQNFIIYKDVSTENEKRRKNDK